MKSNNFTPAITQTILVIKENKQTLEQGNQLILNITLIPEIICQPEPENPFKQLS